MIMKQVVLGTQRFKIVLLCGFLLICLSGFGQVKYEREHRIKKSQFPVSARSFFENNVDEAKKIRYYREVDSNLVTYTVRFRKDRLYYGLQFNRQSVLQHIEFSIKEVDIPEESLQQIKSYLDNNFNKYNVRRISQQYPVSSEQPVAISMRNAFQNLIIESIRYELMFRGKKEAKGVDYEALFGSDGSFINIRKSLPPNYDHVLY